MFTITPTPDHLEALRRPKTLDFVKAADFLGKQAQIDKWIRVWLNSNSEWLPEDLPLCISESIICDKTLKRMYKKAMRNAVVRHDAAWLKRHAVVALNLWPVADFRVITDEMFDVLWDISPVPFDLCAFVVQSRQMHFWSRFVAEYGPTKSLRDAVQQFWSDGVAHCLAEGADVTAEDFVRLCVRNEDVFMQITDCNPPATREAWEEFLLQLLLRRVENVPLVEQWFWIHGFRYKT